MKKVFVILAAAAVMALAVSCGNCCCNKKADTAAEQTVESVECSCGDCSGDCSKCDSSSCCGSCEGCASAEKAE